MKIKKTDEEKGMNCRRPDEEIGLKENMKKLKEVLKNKDNQNKKGELPKAKDLEKILRDIKKY